MLLRARSLVLVLVLVVRTHGDALGALEALLPSYLLDNVEELVRAASAACELVPLELFQSRQSAEAPPMQVLEYRRGGGVRALRAGGVRRARGGGALPVYVPGWGNSPSDAAARALVAALLRHHPVVLVLDTRRAFARPYLAAAARVPAVARALAALLSRLHAGGVAPADVHVIGFSLGAHAAGAAGRLLAAPPGRITALDPARPCFTRSERALRRSDAAFVQVIHSSAGVLGLEAPLGHADVYVNGVAVRQPECAARGGAGLECDHNQAWRVFAASARDSRPLAARRCAGWRELARAACVGHEALLGYQCDTSARGMFLYKTTA